MSEKITLFVAVWIILALFITGDADLEIFFVLILVGMLVTKEFTDRFTTVHIRHRMNVFILLFIMVFILIVGKKIISLLDI
jgi:hypothetical protein